MSLHPLSAQQIAHYREHGYVVIPRVFDAADLARVDATIKQLTRDAIAGGNYYEILELEPQPVDGQPVPRRVYNPFEQHEQFRAIAGDARLLDRVESLVGPDIFLQHSKLNMKAARVGSVVEWHQDLTYFPHTNDDLVTALVYLDDATQENGCLQVLPGCQGRYFSHEAPDGGFAGMITEDLTSPATFVNDAAPRPQPQPRPLEAPAGSVILMHCLTPHSSLPNRSPRSRRTLIYEYRAADSFAIYFGEPVVESEALVHLLRGKPAKHARFGGPPPVIPVLRGKTRSLYELQELTKATVGGVKTIESGT